MVIQIILNIFEKIIKKYFFIRFNFFKENIKSVKPPKLYGSGGANEVHSNLTSLSNEVMPQNAIGKCCRMYFASDNTKITTVWNVLRKVLQKLTISHKNYNFYIKFYYKCI